MKILITGSHGFLGKNLVDRLQQDGPPDVAIYEYNSRSQPEELAQYTKDCDFVFHFVAVHRPQDPADFQRVNYALFQYLLDCLQRHRNPCPVLYTSTIQAINGSDYGNSKRQAEEALRRHSALMGSRGILYRLTNTFGRWARPNGHSVTATFCYNIQRGLPIQIHNRGHLMQFYYIDDVMDSFLSRLGDAPPFQDGGIYQLPDELLYPATLGELADRLYQFKAWDEKGIQPFLDTPFLRKLYTTYRSYAPGVYEEAR